MKLTKDELKAMVSEAASDVVSEQVSEQIKVLEEKQTSWMEQIRSDRSAPTIERDPQKLGFGAARMVRALAAANGDPVRAAQWAERALNERWKDNIGESVHKALSAGDFTGGGFMIPEDMASEIIEYLYNTTKVRQAGPVVLPMNNGSLTLPKQTGSATASYVGEDDNVSSSEPKGGQIVMTAKKLAALVPVSNDLLRFDAGDQADRFIRNDLVSRLAVREDLAFIRGDGSANTPRGMRHWAVSGNIFDSAGTTAANVETDVRTAVDNIEASNLSFDNAVWFMHPRSKNYLVTLRESSGGNLVFPEIRNNMLLGRPVFVTTNIPKNLGGNSNASEIYLVDMTQAILAESMGLEIEVNRGAAYHDGSSVVSGFSKDQTAVRAIEQHDFAMRHGEAVTVLTGVTWGA